MHKDKIFALNRNQHCSHYTNPTIRFKYAKQALHNPILHSHKMQKDEIFAPYRTQHCSHYTILISHFKSAKQALHTTTTTNTKCIKMKHLNSTEANNVHVMIFPLFTSNLLKNLTYHNPPPRQNA